MPPFIIFALPRSRTAWLAKWLSYGGRKVAHDLSLDCDSVEDFIDAFHLGLSGAVETAAIEAWPLIREALPEAKFVVVFRPVNGVLESLRKAGFPVTDEVVRQMEDRHWEMLRLARQPGVVSLVWDKLSSEGHASALFEHVIGKDDFGWWVRHDRTNIQVHTDLRLMKIAERASAMTKLRQQVAEALALQRSGRWLRVGIEPFRTAWPDAEPLCHAHFAEVDGGAEPWRRFVPVVSVMQQLDEKGIMRCITARRGGKFLGYATWNIVPDIESHPLVYAQQGAWYADPDAPGVGLRLMSRSIHLLRRMGVDYLLPHHRLNGRGKDLGALFRHFGATPYQSDYILHLKGS